MSRISTSLVSQRAVEAMLRQQAKVSDTQSQISTGRRVLSPSDDPASASRVLGLNAALKTVQQYQDNAARAQSRLETEEGVLLSATNLLQRVNELTIQGNNATLTQKDSKAIGSEVKQLLDQLLSLANTRDSNGEYIFAGYQTGDRPFSNPAVGSYEYDGDLGQRQLQISPDRLVADGDNGFELFVDVATARVAEVTGVAATPAGAAAAISAGEITIEGGNGSGPVSLGAIPAAADPSERAAQLRDAINAVSSRTGVRAAVTDTGAGVALTAVGGSGITIASTTWPGPGPDPKTGLAPQSTPAASGKRNVFETLHQLATALENNAPVDRFIEDVQLALDNVIDTRTSVGARLNSIDSQLEVNADLELSIKSHRSNEEDLDYAEAIARFERQMTALQAAQQTYVKIKGLSLFNFM